MRISTAISIPFLALVLSATACDGKAGGGGDKSKQAKTDGKPSDKGDQGGAKKDAVDKAASDKAAVEKEALGKAAVGKDAAKGTPTDPHDPKGPAAADGAAADPAAGGRTFRKGQNAPPGLSADELKAYATAQGDPRGGVFSLEDAFAGDEALADKSKGKLYVTFKTNMGEFECELYEDKAPKTIANFVGLGRGVRESYDKASDTWEAKPYYNDTIFHRVIAGFMLQGGDPTGSGTGGPGFMIEDEFGEGLKHSTPGLLSMANRGPNTGSSQFFVTVAKTPHLDGKHAVFGKCDNWDVPKTISEVKVDPRRNHRPYDPVKIETLTFFRK